MKTAKFQYRCRMCGEIEETPVTAEKNALPLLLGGLFDIEMTVTMFGTKPKLLGIHNCKDGSVGVADLIGYKIYE